MRTPFAALALNILTLVAKPLPVSRSLAMTRRFSSLVLVARFAFGTSAVRADTPADLRQQATEALNKGDKDKAVELATAAIDAGPKDALNYFFRGKVQEALRRHAEAVADFGKALELDPKYAEAYQRRGSEQFKRGNVAESVADFDRYL